MNQSKTTRRKLKAAERRLMVMTLRKAGSTYRQIVDEVKNQIPEEELPKDYDERQAYRDVARELEKLQMEIGESAEEIRTIEAERLRSLWAAHYEKASNGDRQESDICLKIHDRIMKLHGLEIVKVESDNKVEITIKHDG